MNNYLVVEPYLDTKCIFGIRKSLFADLPEDTEFFFPLLERFAERINPNARFDLNVYPLFEEGSDTSLLLYNGGHTTIAILVKSEQVMAESEAYELMLDERVKPFLYLPLEDTGLGDWRQPHEDFYAFYLEIPSSFASMFFCAFSKTLQEVTTKQSS